jgi:hypothetical protein
MNPKAFFAMEAKRKHGKAGADENDSYLKPGQKDTDDKNSSRAKAIHKRMKK